jgi:hypothetical protein
MWILFPVCSHLVNTYSCAGHFIIYLVTQMANAL